MMETAHINIRGFLLTENTASRFVQRGERFVNFTATAQNMYFLSQLKHISFFMNMFL